VGGHASGSGRWSLQEIEWIMKGREKKSMACGAASVGWYEVGDTEDDGCDKTSVVLENLAGWVEYSLLGMHLEWHECYRSEPTGMPGRPPWRGAVVTRTDSEEREEGGTLGAVADRCQPDA
jgi:hypothetical protein